VPENRLLFDGTYKFGLQKLAAVNGGDHRLAAVPASKGDLRRIDVPPTGPN
jgi:hypothetical protein